MSGLYTKGFVGIREYDLKLIKQLSDTMEARWLQWLYLFTIGIGLWLSVRGLWPRHESDRIIEVVIGLGKHDFLPEPGKKMIQDWLEQMCCIKTSGFFILASIITATIDQSMQLKTWIPSSIPFLLPKIISIGLGILAGKLLLKLIRNISAEKAKSSIEIELKSWNR